MQDTRELQDAATQSRGAPMIAFVLGLYLLGLAGAIGVALYDIWFNNLSSFRSLGFSPPPEPEHLLNVRVLLMTGLGASLGACLMNLLGLYKHAVVRRDFAMRYVGSHILGPLAVAILGFAVFVLVRAGLLAFGNVNTLDRLSSANEISFVALGVLTGYSWDYVLLKIQRITKEVFASGEPAGRLSE